MSRCNSCDACTSMWDADELCKKCREQATLEHELAEANYQAAEVAGKCPCFPCESKRKREKPINGVQKEKTNVIQRKR